MSRHLLPLALLAVGCAPAADATFSHVATDGQGRIRGAAGVSTASGGALTVEDVTVETREEGGTWEEADDVVAMASGTGLLDVVLVADNSGSEAGYLEEIEDASKHFAQVILARSHDDRVGVVRVSTQSEVLSDLSADPSEVEAAIEEMFITDGWTALWDGLRLANEVLEDGSVEADGADICSDPAFPAIVVFTDGQDNNSCDEHETSYEDDGVCTGFDDLAALEIHEVGTAIHTVGVGSGIDEDALETLAEDSGGRYVEIDSYTGLTGALRSAANRMDGLVPVCFTVPDCDHTEARITLSTTVRGTAREAEYTVELPADTCGS